METTVRTLSTKEMAAAHFSGDVRLTRAIGREFIEKGSCATLDDGWSVTGGNGRPYKFHNRPSSFNGNITNHEQHVVKPTKAKPAEVKPVEVKAGAEIEVYFTDYGRVDVTIKPKGTVMAALGVNGVTTETMAAWLAKAKERDLPIRIVRTGGARTPRSGMFARIANFKDGYVTVVRNEVVSVASIKTLEVVVPPAKDS